KLEETLKNISVMEQAAK
ncbi:hypothetical protein A2U01_0072077, partial [Trifolium medium]|nr:hypothetical protein [Trifolium medium]